MGGYWIAWTRIYRLKDVFASVFANKKFKELKKDQRPPLEIVQLFKSNDFWTNIYAFLRAMHGPLRILRYCDMKTPIMDKLYYLGSQATMDLIKTNFIKGNGNKKKWHVLGCTDSYDPDVNDEETFDNMEINSDLHGLIYTYYHETNDKTVEMVVAPGTVDETGKMDLER